MSETPMRAECNVDIAFPSLSEETLIELNKVIIERRCVSNLRNSVVGHCPAKNKRRDQMVTLNGHAFAAGPPEPVVGELKVYNDAACTQPVADLTEVDFGRFPYTDCGGVQSDKTKMVWCKNESNYPQMLSLQIMPSTDFFFARDTRQLDGSQIAINEVLPVEIGVNTSKPTTGQTVNFQIKIQGFPIGAPS